MRRSASSPTIAIPSNPSSPGGSPAGSSPVQLNTSGVDLDYLTQFSQKHSTKRSSVSTKIHLQPVQCEEARPDDLELTTFDDIERLALPRYRIGDRLAASENVIMGPQIIQKGEKGTVVKGGADFRRGAVVQWDEKPEDCLGRVAPGQFAYEGHGLLPTGKNNSKIVRKEAIVCSIAWLKRTESCQWPTTPIRQGREVSMISGLPQARMKIVPGLTKKNDIGRIIKSISLEIALRPEHFICAFEEPPYARIIWRPAKGTTKESIRALKEFDETASWTVVKRDKGLYVSFESVARPGWFLAANHSGQTVTMERQRPGQQFKDNTTMVVTNGAEPENWRAIEHVDAYAVGDDTVAVKWSPDVGTVRIWSKTPRDQEWEEVETTTGYGRTATVIRGIDFVKQPHLFLVAPMHRRHFFTVALNDGYDLFQLIGAKTCPEWVKHPGMDHTPAARRHALTGEEFHALPQNLAGLKS